MQKKTRGKGLDPGVGGFASCVDEVSGRVGALGLFSSNQGDTFGSTAVNDAAYTKKIIYLLVERRKVLGKRRLHISEAVM